jgi:LytS/YehU family sensor histidine kinase
MLDSLPPQIGLWNIRQRLRLQFGAQSDIVFRRRGASGVLVELRWPRNQALAELAEPQLGIG